MAISSCRRHYEVFLTRRCQNNNQTHLQVCQWPNTSAKFSCFWIEYFLLPDRAASLRDCESGREILACVTMKFPKSRREKCAYSIRSIMRGWTLICLWQYAINASKLSSVLLLRCEEVFKSLSFSWQEYVSSQHKRSLHLKPSQLGAELIRFTSASVCFKRQKDAQFYTLNCKSLSQPEKDISDKCEKRFGPLWAASPARDWFGLHKNQIMHFSQPHS